MPGSVEEAAAATVAEAAVGGAGHALVCCGTSASPVGLSTSVHSTLAVGLVGVHSIFIEARYGKKRKLDT